MCGEGGGGEGGGGGERGACLCERALINILKCGPGILHLLWEQETGKTCSQPTWEGNLERETKREIYIYSERDNQTQIVRHRERETERER